MFYFPTGFVEGWESHNWSESWKITAGTGPPGLLLARRARESRMGLVRAKWAKAQRFYGEGCWTEGAVGSTWKKKEQQLLGEQHALSSRASSIDVVHATFMEERSGVLESSDSDDVTYVEQCIWSLNMHDNLLEMLINSSFFVAMTTGSTPLSKSHDPSEYQCPHWWSGD